MALASAAAAENDMPGENAQPSVVYLHLPRLAALIVVSAIERRGYSRRGTCSSWSAGGRIVEAGEGRAPERGLDCAGDFLVAGLVRPTYRSPRKPSAGAPQVAWPPLAAVLAYDAQIAASAMTTFESVRDGTDLPIAHRDGTEGDPARHPCRQSTGPSARRDRLHVRRCAEDLVEQTGWSLEVTMPS